MTDQSGPSLAGSYSHYFGARVTTPLPTLEERLAARQQLRSHLAALMVQYGAHDALDALHSAMIDEEKRLRNRGRYEDAQWVSQAQDYLDGLDQYLDNRSSEQEERSRYDD